MAEAVPLNELAYRRIRASIAKRGADGRRFLSEGQLARELGMSRTPVREALKRLGVEGLVEIFPRRGTFISVPSVSELREIFEIRQALEGMAARLATHNVSKEALRRFRARLDATYQAREAEALYGVGRELHGLIIARARNRRLREYLATLRSQIEAMFVLGSGLPGQMDLAYREYSAIIRAMSRSAPDEAEEAMRRHIGSVQQRLLSSWNSEHLNRPGSNLPRPGRGSRNPARPRP